ncbi:hypothetical protein BLX87_20530 [Bacillus sp. VT-16-64]|nr:hypothetical protein BLX87_20530 [Bacillus sp. VT-16-64]
MIPIFYLLKCAYQLILSLCDMYRHSNFTRNQSEKMIRSQLGFRKANPNIVTGEDEGNISVMSDATVLTLGISIM